MSYRGVLIGCGFFAQNHMNAWAQVKGADIVAVCDLDAAKAQGFADRFGAKPYTDPAVMLAEVKPDFTDVATTVTSHRALVELAAQHSRVVICQKPFAETWADGQAMVEACNARGVPLVVHENFRWQLPFRLLKDELGSGAIGDPKFLRLSFRHAYDVYANQPYLAEVEDLALTDVGLHLFDVARFLLGDVEHVSCQAQRLNPKVKGKDSFTALLRHTSGAVSAVECSFFSHIKPEPFPETFVWLEGLKGTLEIAPGYTLKHHAADGLHESVAEPDVPSWGEKPWHVVQDSVFAFEQHVVDILDGTAEPQPSGAHNLQTLDLTLAAIRSSKTGEAVSLPLHSAAGEA